MAPPSTYVWNLMMQSYGIGTLVLVIKYTFSQIFAADREKSFLPEDEFLATEAMKNPEAEVFDRRRRIFANDLENIPFHLGIFYAALLMQTFSNASGNGSAETVALTAFFLIYVFARCLHTISYLFALQPWRSISFMISLFSMLGAASLLVAGAFLTSMDKVYA